MLTFRKSTVAIRWMIRRDLPQVQWIQDASYSDGLWSLENWLATLRDRRTVTVVAEEGEQILGYCCYFTSPRSIEVLNLAVDPRRRREGVGTRLIDWLDHRLTSSRTTIATLLDERNLPAQLFLRHCGFRWTETIRGLDADAYLMEYRSGD